MTDIDLQPLFFARAMRDIEAYWARGPRDPYSDKPQQSLVGSPDDQLVPDGVHNPYWELLRHMPWVDDLPWRGKAAYGFASEIGVSRKDFTLTYAWSIPSPGDIAWITGLLNGRGVVEVAAGSGYWAWQLGQAGADVIAYEPNPAIDNDYVNVLEPYVPLLRDDASAAAKHPDRALFLSWPNYAEPWGAHALASYTGDLLFYTGEGEGGCCADDSFFELLDAEWAEVGDSPHHRTWWGINCRLTAYRRGGAS